MKINNGWNNNNTEDMSDIFCNNCGKPGHLYHQCKMPITSIGIVAYRIRPDTLEREYLMIRRKDTLGYMDFMRGKFPIYQKNYIMNMLLQMTVEERKRLRVKIKEGLPMKEKIQNLVHGVTVNSEKYDLSSLLDESDQLEVWTEPEWGFPKGRRNTQEKDYDCALREFSEETGYPITILKNIRNIMPFEEVFIGSNYKSYRHKYYLMNISYADSMNGLKSYQKSEVSSMEWKTMGQCLESIRTYNLEKKRMLQNVDRCLESTIFCGVGENTPEM
jgi:8-oxo-dGTP pyrophosphatase MutT (NUDIX family)